MNIVLASDQNLIGYVPPLVRSLAAHHSNLKLHLLLRGCEPPTLAVPHVAYDMAAAFPEFALRQPLKHVTFSTMDRLAIPDLIGVDRALYLDIDMVVMGSLEALYNADAGASGIAARPSIHPNHRTLAKTLHTWGYPLKVPSEWRSFNAGVLLMDCDRLRALGFGQGCLELVRQHGLNDQAAMSCWCQGQFRPAEPKWNVFVSQEADPVADARILHWAGSRKPWHNRAPLRDKWTRYCGGPCSTC